MQSRLSRSSPTESCNRPNKSNINQVVLTGESAGAAKMSGQRNLGNVWKKRFMNTKTVEEQNISDEEFGSDSEYQPSLQSHGCCDYRQRRSDRESSEPGVNAVGGPTAQGV